MQIRRKTSAQNQQTYRKNHPEYKITEATRTKARYRAMAALARKYPKIYARLYEAELRKLREEK